MARIAVIGASGGVGRLVVQQAVEAGHTVTAAMRTPAPTPGATVVACDVLDPRGVASIVSDQDAVISCVGIRRANPDNPWSRLTTPADVISRGTSHIIAAMPAGARIVIISSFGVDDSAHQMPLIFRALVNISQIGVAYRDLAVAEGLLRASDLDWTAVRPAALWDGPLTGAVREFRREEHVGARWISRADVAAWMIRSALQPGNGDRTPSIAT